MRLEMHTVRVLIIKDHFVYSNYVSYIFNIFSTGSFLSASSSNIILCYSFASFINYASFNF